VPRGQPLCARGLAALHVWSAALHARSAALRARAGRRAALSPASATWRSRSIAAARLSSCADSASTCAPRAAPGSESCEQWRHAGRAGHCAACTRVPRPTCSRSTSAPCSAESACGDRAQPPARARRRRPPCRDAQPRAGWRDWSKAVKRGTGGGVPAAAKWRAGRRAARCAERAPHSAAPPAGGRVRPRAQPRARAGTALCALCGRGRVTSACSAFSASAAFRAWFRRAGQKTLPAVPLSASPAAARALATAFALPPLRRALRRHPSWQRMLVFPSLPLTTCDQSRGNNPPGGPGGRHP
jgi:hypothetical protein